MTPIEDSQFIILPGLADPDAMSIQSVNFPGLYLRHDDSNLIMLGLNDGSDAFAGSATWYQRPGLAAADAISFESYDQPGSYVGQKFGVVALVKEVGPEDRPPARRCDLRHRNAVVPRAFNLTVTSMRLSDTGGSNTRPCPDQEKLT